MYTRGMTTEERHLFEQTLVKSHQIKIELELLTLNMDPAPYISDISNYLLDGQVTVSAGADTAQRSLTLSLLDPRSDLRIDTGTPEDGIIYADRMVRVWYKIWIPESTRQDKWIGVPIFTGPITKYDRTGATLSLEAQSKEVLAGPVFKTYTITKGTNKVDAIKQIMRKAGEDDSFFRNLGDTTGVLSSDLTGAAAPKPANTKDTKTEPEQTIMWSQAEDIAQGLDRFLYYDGEGYLNMRKFPDVTSFVFQDGTDGTVQGEPQLNFDPALLFNVVRIDGKAPTSGTTPSATKYAPEGHPLSAQSLGRKVGGVLVPRYLASIEQSDAYTSESACGTAAQRKLDAAIDESIEVSFNSLVIPHLEPNDQCLLSTVTPAINSTFRLRNYTIPLNSSGQMTVGYTKNQKIQVQAIRNRGTF